MHAVGDVLGNGSGPNEIIDTGLIQIIEGEAWLASPFLWPQW